MNDLEKRIIDLSYKHKLSHISSCLNCVNLIAKIYGVKRKEEPFVLGCSHAALGLFAVLEASGHCDAEEMIVKHGTHAGRDMNNGIWCSGGSLGQAESISLGFALADLSRRVWLVTSDGACLEGVVHETMRMARKHCPNLKTFVIFNGHGAFGEIDGGDIPLGPEIIDVDETRFPEWLRGIDGHYLVLTKSSTPS